MAQNNKERILLVIFAFILFSIFIAGISWFAALEDFRTTGTSLVLLLAFAAGLSMIIMPCTLPLIFLIVPMTMGKSYKKGFLMALLFGIGLTITITLYGIATAWLGQIVGLGRSQTIIIFIAGIAAYTFGLSELKIIKIKLPAYHRIPSFVQKQGDYSKSFFLGLLLGNAGVGCPNPAFYVLLFYIAGSGDLLTGATVGFVHGLGRAMPLLMLSILGLLGIEATKGLVKRASQIQAFVGYSLIFLGAYLLVTAIFGIGWWIIEVPNYAAWLGIVVLIALPTIIKQLIKDKTLKQKQPN